MLGRLKRVDRFEESVLMQSIRKRQRKQFGLERIRSLPSKKKNGKETIPIVNEAVQNTVRAITIILLLL